MNTSTATQVASAHPELAREYSEKLRGALVRSATDRGFRQKLLSDSKAALSEYTGVGVTDVNIVFIENNADATIVLPDAVGSESELSERELEVVAGGTDPCVGTIILSIVAIATGVVEAINVRNSK
jgi:hypothetical protein